MLNRLNVNQSASIKHLPEFVYAVYFLIALPFVSCQRKLTCFTCGIEKIKKYLYLAICGFCLSYSCIRMFVIIVIPIPVSTSLAWAMH